ncbi:MULTISPECIES: LPS export ABC transporter permease LptG [unclassified Wenzhouxiangella]|uniref:LPS export ABC transporter permease LptG n=1 Tax=unclassified Wenzhouxiangella TaxID=2613841 RepID=UPI0015F25CF7|nr:MULTISPECIES: LPS export ABC transporter permease LptG [unclassified Wenzhouxiangella]
MIAGIFGRYISRTVLVWVLIVAVLLAGLYTLIELVREAQDLIRDYGPLQMLSYLAQTTPSRVYDIFPFAALIGTMLGLGGLAGTNELVAMRAAGYDRGRILGSVMLAVGGCLIILFLLAEFVIPGLETRANAQRDQLRSGQVHLGRFGALWLRDGSMMVRIGYSAWSDENRPEFGDVLIYRLNEAGMQPELVMHAEHATHTGREWELRGVSERGVFESAGSRREQSVRRESTLSYDLFSSAVSKPRMLAIADLMGMISLLDANNLDTGQYRQALWSRLFFPLNVLAMILVSLPFTFRGARQGGRGLSIFVGLSLGLMFFVISRLIRGTAMLWPGPLWLLMILPALFFGVIGLLLLRKL